MARRGAAFKNGFLLDFTMSVAGLDETAKALFATSPLLRRRVREAIQRQAEAVSSRASSVELRSMVAVRRGRLAAGMTYRLRQREETTSALVWNKAPHFWMMSHGSPKNEVMVNPFWRRVTARDRHGIRSARGYRNKKGVERTSIRRGLQAMGVTHVSAKGGGPFHRKLNLRRRPFLATAWAAVRGGAEQDLVDSVRQAVAEVQADLAGAAPKGGP